MPLPDDFKLTVPEKKEYELLPKDTYQVRITKLDLKKDQPIYNSTEVEDKLAFEFVVVEEGEYKGRRLWLDVRTIMSAGSNGYSPSWLYKLFCAINRVMLSDEEAKGVAAKDIDSMLGQEVRLVVTQQNNRKGEPKNKITDVLPLKGQISASADTAKPAEPLISEDINVDDIPF